jgi:hypothetical protein
VLPGVSKCFGGPYDRATDPWVSFAPNGSVFASSLGFDAFDAANGVLVSKSLDGGNSWSTTSLIADTYTGALDDKESVTADPYAAGYVYVAWDRTLYPPSGMAADQAVFHAHAYRQQTWFSRTTNGGATWEPARQIYDPGTQAGTVGNVILALPNGDLVDGFFVAADHKQKQSYDVAVIRSTDKGVTWSKNAISVASLDPTFLAPYNPDNGHFIRSGGLPDFAADPASGKLYAVWEDDRPTANVDAIQFSQSTDGGQTWSTPVKINQTPTNIPPEDQQAFTPTVKVTANGTVGVTYYDLRENTPAPGLPTNYWLVHCHGGCTSPANWAESHVAGPFDMEQAATVGTHGTTFLGDYQGMATFANAFMPFFAQAGSPPGSPGDPSDVYFTALAQLG